MSCNQLQLLSTNFELPPQTISDILTNTLIISKMSKSALVTKADVSTSVLSIFQSKFCRRVGFHITPEKF